ncbi:MAG: hypothetical protein ACO1OB_22400 [Archangium sp.]
MRRHLGLISGFAAALWAFVISSRQLVENDVFWHLMLGRAVSRSGSRTVVEPSAFTFGQDRSLSVPEWLWDLLAWFSWQGGEAALSVFVCACAAVAAGAVVFAVSRSARGVVIPVVSAVVLAALSVRIKERPETLALAWAALFMGVSTLLVRRFTVGRAVALVALEILWAQTHGTFVLAVPMFVAAVLNAPLKNWPRLGGVLVVVVVALISGPAGFGVVGFVSSHVSGDAVAHIIDMADPTWADFNPGVVPYHFIAAALTLVALLGALTGAWTWSSLAFMGLGLIVASTSLRGVAWWALFLVPQLAVTLNVLRRRRFAVVAMSVVAVSTLSWVTVRFEKRQGPFFSFSVKSSELPYEAVAAMPDGATVWTGFEVGSAVGLISDGRVRVSIDSRTPMVFDDAAFALSRDCSTKPECLKRAFAAMNVSGAVVERSAACVAVMNEGSLAPVSVNARYAGFAKGAAPLTTIDVCSPMYVTAKSCDEAAFAADLDRLRLAGDQFTSFLEQAAAVRCGRAFDLPKLEALLSSQRRWPALMVVVATAREKRGDAGGAAELSSRALTSGFSSALGPLQSSLGRLDAKSRASVLDEVINALDDQTPSSLRALRALTAAENGEDAVARVQSLRAAAAGEKSVLPVLQALAKTAAEPVERAEYEAWVRVLSE